MSNYRIYKTHLGMYEHLLKWASEYLMLDICQNSLAYNRLDDFKRDLNLRPLINLKPGPNFWKFQNKEMTWNEFASYYELEKIRKYIDELLTIAENQPIIIVGYDANHKYCQRDLIANYLLRTKRIVVEELTPENIERILHPEWIY